MQATIYSNVSNVNYYCSKPGFFKRQFDLNVTSKQKTFDVIFGIILPILCFIFDPIFFHSWLHSDALFGSFQLFAYAVAAIEISTLVIWFLPYRRPEGIGRMFGSLMMAGALFSFVLGFILLPFTLIGLIFLIGFLGLVPFLTGFVYLRNGVRALKRGGWDIDAENLVLAFILGSVFALGGPMMLQWRIWELTPRWITDVKNDSQDINSAKFNLKAFGYLTNYTHNQLIQTYNESSDYEQRERLSSAYKEITGNNIEDEIRRIDD